MRAADLNHDGLEDGNDTTLYFVFLGNQETLAWGDATHSGVDNRFGYAGYRWDRFIGKYHVRHRTYDAWLSQWMQRDPIGFGGGTPSLYEYVSRRSFIRVDPLGLQEVLPVPPADLSPIIDKTIGFYNPEIRTRLGWEYARDMAERQYDCPIPVEPIPEPV